MLLAIETSCDDSAVALFDDQDNLIANVVSSQIKTHARFGGVVPEIASRQHLKNLPPLLELVFEEGNISIDDLTAVAVTYTPGLIGSLLIGVSYAKALAWVAGVPLLGIDHLEGHLMAPFLDQAELDFPYLALIASGGHTHMFVVSGIGQYNLIGKTLDDAIGEAFDKVAKMLGFEYPGGPVIDHLAKKCDSPSITYPIPLRGKPTLNFSFSGLKTAVRNSIIKHGLLADKGPLISLEEFNSRQDFPGRDLIIDIAASFQKIVGEIISQRFLQALKKTGLKKMVVTGGVAANSGIREKLQELADKQKLELFFPQPKNCTDNAAMIGYIACQYLKAGKNYDQNLGLNATSKSPLALMNESIQIID